MYETEIALSAKVEWTLTYQSFYNVHQILFSRSRYIPESVAVNKKA